MSHEFSPRVRRFAWIMMLIYFASYLTRINFTVMLVVVCNELNLTKLDLATVITGLTISYGTGQILSGMIADRLKAERLLTFGLCLAAVCNIVMSCLSNVAVMTVIWCINGFAHALLWPPMVRLMSMRLNDREYGYACVRVFWGSSIATILLYLGCPLLLGVLSWRGILRVCAVGGLAIAAIWTHYAKHGMLEPLQNPIAPRKHAATVRARQTLPTYIYFPIVMILLGIIAQGALRDGVTNWMPSFMLETFHLPEEKAIVVTVVLAVISMVCSSFFNWLHQRIIRNEVVCAGVIFAASTLCAGLLLLVSANSVALSALFMAMIVSCMHGVNLMLITVVPKRFANTGKVATFTGLFNSGTYIGAALSTYAFAALADAKGWNATLLTWVIVAAVGTLICFGVAGIWRKYCKSVA